MNDEGIFFSKLWMNEWVNKYYVQIFEWMNKCFIQIFEWINEWIF